MSNINFEKMKKRFEELKNSSSSNNLDKVFLQLPNGKTIVRLLPYKYDDNPFKEVYVYYELKKGSAILSPRIIGQKDPVWDFINELYKSGNKTDKDLASELRPIFRAWVWCIVKSINDDSIDTSHPYILSLSKSNYIELLSIITDPEYGNIFDYKNGRDIILEKIPPEQAKNLFGKTALRIRPNISEATDTEEEFKAMIDKQLKYEDILTIPTEEEMNELLKQFTLDKPNATEETKKNAEVTISNNDNNISISNLNNLTIEQLNELLIKKLNNK